MKKSWWIIDWSLHALNTDYFDEEVLSAASISLYDDITETASHSGHRTDSKQDEINRSSGSAYVRTYIDCQVSFVLTECY